MISEFGYYLQIYPQRLVTIFGMMYNHRTMIWMCLKIKFISGLEALYIAISKKRGFLFFNPWAWIVIFPMYQYRSRSSSRIINHNCLVVFRHPSEKDWSVGMIKFLINMESHKTCSSHHQPVNLSLTVDIPICCYLKSLLIWVNCNSSLTWNLRLGIIPWILSMILVVRVEVIKKKNTYYDPWSSHDTSMKNQLIPS